MKVAAIAKSQQLSHFHTAYGYVMDDVIVLGGKPSVPDGYLLYADAVSRAGLSGGEGAVVTDELIPPKITYYGFRCNFGMIGSVHGN